MWNNILNVFSFLDFDTGYSKDDYMKHIHTNCNSGMERQYNENYYIIKNPEFLANIEDDSIVIKKVLIPIRDYKSSFQSRAKHGKMEGGLWNAVLKLDIMSQYIYLMTTLYL